MFGRVMELHFGVPGQTGRRVTGLRMAAHVEMDRSSTANRAVITVWGASDATAGAVQQEGVVVRLLAGHRDSGVRQIFTGRPIKHGVKPTLDNGNQRVLVIEATDAGVDIAGAHVTLARATASSAAAVLTDLTSQLGLPLGEVALPDDVAWPYGVNLTGPVGDALDRIVAATGGDWFVRDGALYVLGAGRGVTEEASVYSTTEPLRNLVGEPTPTKEGVEVTVLCDPAMRPGRPFTVHSERVTGTYVARDVVFDLDSGFDNVFYTRVTGRPRAV